MKRLARIGPSLEALGRMANDKTNLGDARADGESLKDEVIEADNRCRVLATGLAFVTIAYGASVRQR